MTHSPEILRIVYDRRHPAYSKLVDHWVFLKDTYQGGRSWFENHIHKYIREGNDEFKQRKDRAYRFNHTKEAVELVQKYLFKGVINRTDDVDEQVKRFWNSSTLANQDITQLMRMAAVSSSQCGRCAIVVDNNIPTGNVTVAQQRKSNKKIYAYIVDADDILDYAWDEDGDGGLLWVKLRERYRDDENPFAETISVRERQRLWTRTGWMLLEEVAPDKAAGTSQKPIVKIKDEGTHDLGVVPVILHDHTHSQNPYEVSGLIDDIAYLDKKIANYLSNLDAIIQDQTFSTLVVPAQSILNEEDAEKHLKTMGTSRYVSYDASSGPGSKPEYISPDPKQAGVILTVITKIIGEIYHTIGLSGERTKEDNAVGIDNSSGVAKAYDFEKVNSLLSAKAQACQKTENDIVSLVCKWAGVPYPKSDPVSYPTNFDVMRLVDELGVAEHLAKMDGPTEVRREQMRLLIEKLFPRISEETKKTVLKDIDTWLEGADLSSLPSSFDQLPKPPATSQGQNNS